MYHFRSTCLISGLEFPAYVAFLEDEAVGLAACSILFYMGVDNSQSAMTRGDSNTAAISDSVARAVELIQRYHIMDCFSMVPSKLNPADSPTRGKALPFRPARRRGFSSLPKLYRACRDAVRTQPRRAKSRVFRLKICGPPCIARRK